MGVTSASFTSIAIAQYNMALNGTLEQSYRLSLAI